MKWLSGTSNRGRFNVRGRPQHEDAAEEAAASLCPVWSCVAGGAASHFVTSADKLWRYILKNSIVQGGLTMDDHRYPINFLGSWLWLFWGRFSWGPWLFQALAFRSQCP